ncbi:MAG: RNA polymerase sporulation sigma factor SigE [Clostridia bacterium]|nr:RNA polymerase sporulation sigma factor SigE [Clostridia bacterium]
MSFFSTVFKFIIKIKNIIIESYNNIAYVNGAETLPPPLSAEDESRALQEAKHSNGAREMLISHNLRLVVYIAKKFESTGIGIEDLVSIGTIGLIKAINTYKADKNNKLATYASRCIENEILMYIRKNSSKKLEISIEEPLNIDWDGNELLLSDVLGSDDDVIYRDLEAAEERKIIRNAVETLSKRERVIIELRYGLSGNTEKTQKEVADMLGISQSYISRLEKKIINRLRQEVVEKI